MCRSSSFQFLFFTSFQKLRSSPSPPVASAHLLTACSRHMVHPCSRIAVQTSTNIKTRFRMAQSYQGQQISSQPEPKPACLRTENGNLRTEVLKPEIFKS